MRGCKYCRVAAWLVPPECEYLALRGVLDQPNGYATPMSDLFRGGTP